MTPKSLSCWFFLGVWMEGLATSVFFFFKITDSFVVCISSHRLRLRMKPTCGFVKSTVLRWDSDCWSVSSICSGGLGVSGTEAGMFSSFVEDRLELSSSVGFGCQNGSTWSEHQLSWNISSASWNRDRKHHHWFVRSVFAVIRISILAFRSFMLQHYSFYRGGTAIWVSGAPDFLYDPIQFGFRRLAAFTDLRLRCTQVEFKQLIAILWH